MEDNKFDFKFLNKLMYIVTVIIIILALGKFGVLNKIWQILKALTPLYLGIILCWISKPLANRLKKMGLSKGLSAILSLVIIFAIITAVLAYIIPKFVTQVTQFVKDAPTLYSEAATEVNTFLEQKIKTSYRLPLSLGESNILSKYSDKIVNYSIDTVQKVLNMLLSFVISIIISFFLVKDMDRTKNSVILFLSKNGKNANRYKMLKEMDDIVNSYARGLIIDSVIVGIATTILCLILRLKYAIIFGILITFLNLIPYIGAIISYSITTVYAFSVGGPVLAIITFLASVTIQIIDANILQPNIIGKSVKLSPVAVICGMLVFEKVFGIVGMIIAMPLLAIIKIYIKYKFDINFDGNTDNLNKEKNNVKRKELSNKQ